MSSSEHVPADEKVPLTVALASVANAIFITDEVGRIVWVNDACCRLTGYAADELIGNTPAIFKSGRQSDAYYADMWQTILAGNDWRGNLVERRKDNVLFTVDETITPLLDLHGNITHFIAIQHDMTLRSQEDEKNRYLAFHDVLTGLPNRALFLKIQQQAMSHAQRGHRLLALLFLDIDKFKSVNDTLGHNIGDQLLIAAAERMRSAIRKVDLVSRFGGDEFALLLTELLDRDVAVALARKLLDSLAQPFVLGDRKIEAHTHASIGIAIYPTDCDDPETLLAHADQAMYAAKSRGGNKCVVYGESVS